MPWMKVWYPADDDDYGVPREEDKVPPQEELTFEVPTGIFADRPAKTGRVYSRAVLEDLIRKTEEVIGSGRAIYGELDPAEHALVHFDRVSHVVMGLRIAEDGQLMGKIMVCWCNYGRVAQAAILEGLPVHLKPRTTDILEGERLPTWDLVLEPAIRKGL